MEEYLHNSDLDAPYWTAVFEKLKMTIESFEEIDATLLNNLLGMCRHKDENEKIVKFIFMMKQNYPTVKQKTSENKLEGSSHLQKCDYTPENVLALTKEWHIEDLTIQEIQERLEFFLDVKKKCD